MKRGFIKYCCSALVLLTSIACVKESDEKTVMETPKPVKPDADTVRPPKSEAKGKPSEPEPDYENLTAEQLQALAQKRSGDEPLALMLVRRKASEKLRAVVKKILSTTAIEMPLREKLAGQALSNELRNINRPVGENAADRHRMIATILERYPEQINDIKKTDESFDIAVFNDIVATLDKSQISPLLDKLEQRHMDAWLAFVLTDAQGPTVFKQLYNKASALQKERMRSALLAHSYDPDASKRKDKVLAFINNAEAYGLKDGLGFDKYVLSSSTPGTSIAGSLLYVLSKGAIGDESRAGSVPGQALKDLRTYATSIKAAIGDPDKYKNYVADTPFGPQGSQESIASSLKHALSKSQAEDFANYYLAIDKPKLVLDSANKPSSELSNKMLRELYDVVIDSDAKAVELADKQVDGSGGQRFIHALAKRPVDSEGFLSSLLDKFLTSLSNYNNAGVKAQTAQVVDAGAEGTPTKILSNAARLGDDPSQKAKIVARLIEADDGTALAGLDKQELEAYVDSYFAGSGSGGTGAADFNLMYSKITDPDKKQIMRSRLLAQAYQKGMPAVQSLLDDIAGSDPWGLKSGLNTDLYALKTSVGSLLYVLSKQALDLSLFRGFAKALKIALKNEYDAHVSDAEWNGETIKKVLTTKLQANHRQNFVDYYLARENANNVYEASERPENQVTNAMLKELYEVVIGNSKNEAEKLAAEPSDVNKLGFIHQLLKRSADAEGNSRYVLNKFLSDIGAAQETAQLLESREGQRPLKIFVESLGKLKDDNNQKAIMLARLLRHAPADAFQGVSSSDLSALVPLLIREPANFKKMSGFYEPNSEEAQALRSALLMASIDQGVKATKKLITEITNPDDIWGLKAGLGSDKYQLTQPPAQGTLLDVLTKRALDDKKLGVRRAYTNLKDYAQLLKQSLDADYDAYARSAASMLAHELGDKHKNFVNTYLAKEQPADVFAAASQPAAEVSNAELKELYSLIIGKDEQKTKELAMESDQKERFIHRLLKRAIDSEGHASNLLDKFLSGLNDSSAELAQLNERDDANKYPIELVAQHEKADPKQVAIMLERLLRHDDKTASASLTDDKLSQMRFFSGGEAGKTAFKKLYTLLKVDPTKAKAMRSALLADAFQGSSADVTRLIEEIANDDWGLKPELDTDIYELEIPNSPDKHKGTLIDILAERAMEDANNPQVKDAYTALRTRAEKLRPALTNYVEASREALAKLKNHLDATHPGFAEYYLIADKGSAGLDENLVLKMVSIADAKIFDINVLKWLFDTIILDETTAQALADLRVNGADKFIHYLVRKPVSKLSLALLENFFSKLKPENVPAQIEDPGQGKNALQLALDNRSIDSDKAQMIASLVSRAGPAAIAAIKSEEAQALLKAIKQKGKTEDLEKLFKDLSDEVMGAVAEWSAENISDTVIDLFKAQYDSRSPEVQEAMRNHLFKKGYELGYARSVIAGGLKDVAELIAQGFLKPDIMKSSSFDPFATGTQSSLLYAILKHARPSKESDLNELVTQFKKLFSGDEATLAWQAFVQDKHNADNTQSLLDLVQQFVPGPDAEAKEKAAKEWLRY